MAENFVQVAVDGAGKQVDTFTVIDPTTSATKHRQAIVIGDPTNPSATATVNNGALYVEDIPNVEGESNDDLLKLILIELRILTWITASEFRVRDDIEKMRADMQSVSQT
jgi:hypothetical protein